MESCCRDLRRNKGMKLLWEEGRNSKYHQVSLTLPEDGDQATAHQQRPTEHNHALVVNSRLHRDKEGSGGPREARGRVLGGQPDAHRIPLAQTSLGLGAVDKDEPSSHAWTLVRTECHRGRIVWGDERRIQHRPQLPSSRHVENNSSHTLPNPTQRHLQRALPSPDVQAKYLLNMPMYTYPWWASASSLGSAPSSSSLEESISSSSPSSVPEVWAAAKVGKRGQGHREMKKGSPGPTCLPTALCCSIAWEGGSWAGNKYHLPQLVWQLCHPTGPTCPVLGILSCCMWVAGQQAHNP